MQVEHHVAHVNAIERIDKPYRASTKVGVSIGGMLLRHHGRMGIGHISDVMSNASWKKVLGRRAGGFRGPTAA